MAASKETMQFQTEINQLLQLMIHSLISDLDRCQRAEALLTVSHSSPGLPPSPILRIRIDRGM